MAEYQGMLEKTTLTNMHTRGGGTFTWFKGLIGDRRSERKIDRTFMNDHWVVLWPTMVRELYQGGSSNHVGLLVRLHPIKKPRRLFIFF